MKLIVKEIFYSLQGEGNRSGEASIFVRLSKCNLSCNYCDTNFADGTAMSVEDILQTIQQYSCRWIVWTGGEPTLQLSNEYLARFEAQGYKQAIETNGTRAVPSLIDYIACSPKQYYANIKTIIPVVDEIRIPIAAGDELPDISILPQAEHYFLSPIFNGDTINVDNVNYCVMKIMQYPQWKLSLQMHKLINIE